MDARTSRYHEVYARWLRDPQGFWGEAAADIDWIEPAKAVFDAKGGVYGRWFPGAVCNTCYNALDRHVLRGRGSQPALIYDSPVTNTKRTFTYAELLAEVKTLAAVLKDFGVGKGDRVILYMPMVPEALFAMLACARIGAIHSVVFGGFAAKELATRLEDCKPKLILSASCGIEVTRVIPYKPLLDAAIDLSSAKPEACIILQRPQLEAPMVAGRDHDWATLVGAAKKAGKSADCVPVAATDPLYILYTSGTTGRPKGVVRDNGGHMVALKWSMKNVYGVEPGEPWWSASDVGWVVGHSYIVYAPLFHGCTSVLYEGKPVGTPDAGAFWRVISEHKCVAMFTAPTAFRAIKKEDPQGKFFEKYDLSKFRTLFLAGERADPDTIVWAENLLEEAGDRSLVADRDRLGDRRQSGRPRPASDQARLADRADAGLRPARGRRRQQGSAARQDGIAGRQAAAAAVMPADLVAGRRPHARELPRRISRLLQNGGRRLHRRGRLRVRDGPHRRHHQCRRPPAFDRRHGGGAVRAQGRRRMRGARHQGRAQGRGAVRLHRAQGRRQSPGRRDRAGVRGAGARQGRSGGGVQARHRGGAAAEDALRQDSARHHEEDRRRRALDHAGDDRRPGDPR